MSQPAIPKQPYVEEKPGLMSRWGANLADWSEKWFPDAYIFAVIAVVIVAAVALMLGRTPTEVAVDFGKAFWSLVPFTMQMAFVIITGYVVAVSKPVKAIITKLAAVPSTPKVAVAYVAFVAMMASLLS